MHPRLFNPALQSEDHAITHSALEFPDNFLVDVQNRYIAGKRKCDILLVFGQKLHNPCLIYVKCVVGKMDAACGVLTYNIFYFFYDMPHAMATYQLTLPFV